MYGFIDGLCFLGGLAGFTIPIVKQKYAYCTLGIAWIAFYPILTQSAYNLFVSRFGSKVQYSVNTKSRFVYSDQYNLTFCGLQKLHPFDGSKYYNVVKRLIDRGLIKKQDLIKPEKISRNLLLEKMSKWYLLKLCYTLSVCSIIQMKLFFLPSFLLRLRVLNPMLTMTQGTILASCAALQKKWAINIGGGFHHAHFEGGSGFCIYPDISLAVHYLQTRMRIKKIMVVDLDAHQGNGHQRDHINNSLVYTVDCYNHQIFPQDQKAKKGIKSDLSVSYNVKDDQYLRTVSEIQSNIDYFKPEFIIYNAGTDIIKGDPLGGCNITPQGIIKRDQLMFEMALKKNIPIVMVLSGGYQPTNAEVISNSIQNIIEKFDK